MDYFEITNKEELLSKYTTDYLRLKGIIEKLPEDIIDFVPDLKDAWSIRGHCAHLMDTEIRAYIRYINAVVVPGTDLKLGGGDVNVTNSLLNYSSRGVDESLEVIRLLRNVTVQHVMKMTDDDMMRYGILHPDFGKINLRMIMSIYTQHVDFHIEYIDRNIKLFKQEKNKSKSASQNLDF